MSSPARRVMTAPSSTRCGPGRRPAQGPAGRAERLRLATEMLALAQRTQQRPHCDVGRGMADRGAARERQLSGRGRGARRVAGRRRASRRTGQRVAPRPRHCLHRPGPGTLRRRRRRRSSGFRADAGGRARAGNGRVPRAAVALWSGHFGVTRRGRCLRAGPVRCTAAVRDDGPASSRFLLLRAGLPDEAAASYQQVGLPMPGRFPPSASCSATCSALS